MRNKICWLVLFVFVALPAMAQNNATTNEDLMRSEGKIYVVMAIVLTILAGLIVYVIRLDRKMTRLEKNDLT